MASIDPKMLALIVIAVVAAALIVWAVVRQRRTVELQKRFGPEYERTLRTHGPGKTDAVLMEREQRVKKFTLRKLSGEERERWITEWRTVQSRFVDDPQRAVTEADKLVGRVMEARGYPLSDFEQRAEDISVDHPHVVDNYRAAHEIALRHQRGEAMTEDLRRAMIYYRTLFDDLLETTNVTTVSERREVA